MSFSNAIEAKLSADESILVCYSAMAFSRASLASE